MWLGSIPDDKCSLWCSSWMPKTSVLHWALDYSLLLVYLMNPPLKFSGSDLSSWWPGSLWHGLLPCHSFHAWRRKQKMRALLKTYSTKAYTVCMVVFLLFKDAVWLFHPVSCYWNREDSFPHNPSLHNWGLTAHDFHMSKDVFRYQKWPSLMVFVVGQQWNTYLAKIKT